MDKESKSVETQMNLGASVNGAAGKVEGNQIINIFNTTVSSNSTSLETTKLAFAIAGTIDNIDKAKLNAIAALLRKISGDTSIEIIDVKEGSIKIILGGSEEGLRKIQELFESGELTEVEGFPVEYVQFLTEAENKKLEAKSQLVQDIAVNMTAPNKRTAREQARSAINKWALGVAGVAWIPGAHYPMTGGDVAMVMQIGSIFEVDMDRTQAGTVFSTIAAPLIGSKVAHLAHSALDFIPVIGWGAKSLVAAEVIKAVGEALIAYFNDCSNLPEE